MQYSKAPIQTFDSQAKEKLRSLVAAADNRGLSAGELKTGISLKALLDKDYPDNEGH
ncbi:hypothetical protein [Nostoc sp. 'Peltigera membranacea cyanobiont' 232]|uniref:hypothetical protein n=1 Tax=Nostoc sp. 'Peltigera membranacea cyanobiont' 232 TaxID=2014531 RepID=UPI00167C3D5C|nr:hypothetical protein [Nostoc sp. 'Peltigera membranacea cyanobiont' 232]